MPSNRSSSQSNQSATNSTSSINPDPFDDAAADPRGSVCSESDDAKKPPGKRSSDDRSKSDKNSDKSGNKNVTSPRSDSKKSDKNKEEAQSPKTEKESERSTEQDTESQDGGDPKQGKKKYGFRLTPEEQELAYELKAGMMRKLDDQNAKLNRELANHNKFQGVRQKQNERAYSAKYSKDDKLSRVNAIKLMRMYEKRAKDAEDKSKTLQADLDESQDLARRYREMYLAEKGKNGGQNSSRNSSRGADGENKDKDSKEEEGEEVNDDDLDDEIGLYKRHVSKLAESGKMITTSPIRIADIIRKNEVLIIENDNLRREIKRLKYDNGELIKKVKHSREEKDKLLHNISTSESARIELLKRLDREQREHKRLHKSLTLQASDWIQARKEMQSIEDNRKWQQIGQVSVLGAEERTYSHPVKKNTALPRAMYPAERYATH